MSRLGSIAAVLRLSALRTSTANDTLRREAMTDRAVDRSRGARATTRLAWALLVGAVALGTFARLHALGLPPVSVDEYYFLVSVESILATGIPEPPGGGYYVRGLPVQYLTAASILLFGGPELGLRVPMILFGLGSAVLGFLFGRRIHSRELGLALAVVLLVSSWSVEFSRFGRMYAGFQFFTLLFLLSYYRVMAGKAAGLARYLPHLWMALAVPTHRLAMMLVPLLALPAVVPGAVQRLGGRRQVASYLVVTGAAVVALLAYYLVPFRSIGVVDRFPAGSSPGADLMQGPGLLLLPAFPFWALSDSDLVNLLGALTAMGLAAGVLQLGRLRGNVPSLALTLAVMAVVAALLHQLLLVAALGVVLLARFRIHKDPRSFRTTLVVLGLAGVVSLGWLAYASWLTYGAGSREWLIRAGAPVFRYGISSVFFGWPRFYEPVILPWYREMPVLAVLLLIGVVYQIITRLDRPVAELARNPALVVLYVLVLFGTLDSLYHTTRYTYFVYPVALAALFITVHDLLRIVGTRTSTPWLRAHLGACAVAVFVGAFALTEDFNPRHLVGGANPEVIFRTGDFEPRRATWYFRTDYRGAGRFVSATAPPDAYVVVVDSPPVSYYIDRSHAVYLPRVGVRFRHVARRQGTLDYWSGQRLLSTPAELAEHAQHASELWLIRRAERGDLVVDLSAAFAAREHVIHRMYLTIDGGLEVLRVELGPHGTDPTGVAR